MTAPVLPSLSVVVPAYRSPTTLAQLVQKVLDETASLASTTEIIFVDDGSPDDTWERVTALSRAHPEVRALRLSRNYGQHNALLAGVRAATGDLVLTMDDDMQNPPDQIPVLFAALAADIDLVYGYAESEQQSAFRNVASRSTKRMMRAGMGDAVNPRHSAFRLFRRRLVGAAAGVRDPFVSLDVVLSWATARQAAVPVRFDVRSGGVSGYTFNKLVRHALNMITGFGVLPLRIVSWLGFALSLVGFALAGYVVVRFLFFGTSVQGFTFLAAAINVFAGAQLLSIGVLGEYLGRVHFRSMGRPVYLVAGREGWNDSE